MVKTIFHANSGLRSYDLVELSSPVELTDVFPSHNDFGAMRQPPQHKGVEFYCAALPDHMVVLHLTRATRFYGGFEGRVRRLSPKPGDIELMPAGSESRWNACGGDADVMHLHLSPKRLSFLLGEDGPEGKPVELIPQLSHADGLISRLGRNCIAELRHAGLASHALLDSYALALGVHLLRQYSSVRKLGVAEYALAPYRLRRAKDFVEAHLAEDIGVVDIAAAAGLSAFHFSRAFRKATGLSPYRYLIERRIAHAESLLGSTDLSIAAVALSCGFSSQQHLSSTFSKIVGTTPARFRHSYRI